MTLGALDATAGTVAPKEPVGELFKCREGPYLEFVARISECRRQENVFPFEFNLI